MLRIFARTASNVTFVALRQNLSPGVCTHVSQVGCLKANFRVYSRGFSSLLNTTVSQKPMSILSKVLPNIFPVIPKAFPIESQSRSVTKFSRGKGIRKSVKPVIKRFLRLGWGAWIRTRSGRHKKLWKRSPSNKYRMSQHVFVSGSQATFLDKCVTKFWRRRRYYINDIYAPYHERPDYFVTKNPKYIY